MESLVRARPAALGLTNARGVATPGTDDAGGPKTTEISELRRMGKWRDTGEEIVEEDDFLTGEELKCFQSVAARFNFFAMDRPDLLYSVKELMRQRHHRALEISLPSTEWPVTQSKYPRMACRYLWTPLNSNIEVYGDANFAQCISTRKSTVGGVALWSGQFVEAWSKTVGVLALSSGESELGAVVRAATEGLGLQSILSDFDFGGHVAIKSDATAATGMVYRIGLGKVRHLAVGDLFSSASSSFVKIRVSRMSGLENPGDA